MTHTVEKLAGEVKALPKEQLEEFLDWLTEFESGRTDAWDGEIARDGKPGGRLQDVVRRAKEDIDAGRTKPLDEVIDDK